MAHALRPAGGAGGVDQDGLVFGRRVGIGRQGRPRLEGGDIGGAQDDAADDIVRIEGYVGAGHDHGGPGILRQERRLGRRQLREGAPVDLIVHDLRARGIVLPSPHAAL